MNRDFRDLFCAFNDVKVRYLVVGAYAVIHYTDPRYTKDLDIWVEPVTENAVRTLKALADFGAPIESLTIEDLCNPELVYQIGIEPNRIDILMGIKGIEFQSAWENAEITSYGNVPIRILSREDIITAKRASGRLQDLLDLERLEAAIQRKK